MELILIRHTRLNIGPNICYGQTDVDVATTFFDEVEAVKEQLLGARIDRVYSSPLRRCAKLAKQICPPQLDIIYDKRLMELNFGDWEGRNWAEIEDVTRPFFEKFDPRAKCPGGESLECLAQRVKMFLDSINQKEGSVCIVSHGGPIRAMISHLNGNSAQAALNAEVGYGQVFFIEKSI